ncbi:MAG: ribonuclease III [Limnobacter sp.]|nr:ribonuclease III [Limnobacter sp.]
MAAPLEPFESQLGHHFSSRALLQRALTHRSYSAQHNERLEFLGDSVLNCAASILLYREHPTLDEGKLSRIRSHLVKQDCLAQVGRAMDLPAMLLLGAGEVKSGVPAKDSIVADAVEAVFGAVLLDAGFDAACQCILKHLKPILESVPIQSLGKDPKPACRIGCKPKKASFPVTPYW